MADDGRPPQAQNATQLKAYSRRIARLRLILPIIAVLLLALLVLAANPDLALISNDDAAPENAGHRLLINDPVFDGRVPDGRAYRLTALQGMQKDDGIMAFTNAQMNIAANEQNPSLFFTANKGVLHPPTGPHASTAQLSGNVVVTTGDGYQITAPQIAISLADALWRAEDGVTMQGRDSTLRAARLEADETGGVYRFENIRMRLVPGRQEER